MAYDYNKYLRKGKLPHIWCPGCGYGIILKSLIRVIDSLGWEKDNTVIASGIGCASRLPGYVDFNTIHTTHGRSLAFATGIKMAKPQLNVIVLGGDGDMSAIGGNHLIHACRRNINLSLLIFNNSTYGMTGGQFSPTTPKGKKATTAPKGMSEPSFDISRLAIGAGATYVARTSTYHVAALDKLMKESFEHTGFSVLEIISGCPTGYGRKNGQVEGYNALEWQKENAVPIATYEKLSEEEKEGKFSTGLLHKRDGVAEFIDVYDKTVGLA